METKMKTTIHYYKFNLDNVEEAKKYSWLRGKLKNQGLTLFDSMSLDHNDYYRNKIKPLNLKKVELDTANLFNNQWNTAPTETSDNGLRVFDWAEAIYENRNIKEGQYLDQTVEMTEIRQRIRKCGYCGKHYDIDHESNFCNSCLDSEYLEEKDLFLLRLLPISESDNNCLPLTEAEETEFIPRFTKAQIEGLTERGKKRIAKQRQDIESKFKDTTQNAKNEHDGLLWLLDNGVNINNCIYYDHTSYFCFGWKVPVSKDVRSKLLDMLNEFPFDYDIK